MNKLNELMSFLLTSLLILFGMFIITCLIIFYQIKENKELKKQNYECYNKGFEDGAQFANDSLLQNRGEINATFLIEEFKHSNN